MYKLMIFDLDGTLLDTLEDLANASNYALNMFDFEEHEIQKYKTFVGDGVYKLIERIVPESHRQKDTLLKVKEAFQSYYDEHNRDATKPYEGIVEVLKHLRKKGIHTAVVSNKPHSFTIKLVEELFGDSIEIAYGQRDGIPTKPNPVAVLEVIKHFEIAKEECIYIGDTNVDIHTGKNAGIKTVGVLWGFRTEEELRQAGADYIASKVEDLYQF